MSPTTLLATVAGLALVAVVLSDVLRSLWRPSGLGHLTRPLLRAAWAVTRRAARRRSTLDLAGPVGMLLVLSTWALVTVLGFAVVYLPHVPEGVVYSGGLADDIRSPFVDAVYLSLVTAATLGYGDIVPEVTGLRLLAPLQALVGFVLLTAAVTWVLQVYPALGRRRALALRLTRLDRTGTAVRLAGLEDSVAVAVLQPVLDGLLQVRIDLDQYNESYFFADSDSDAALPLRAQDLLELSGAALRCRGPGTRLVGEQLDQQTQDLASTLGAHGLLAPPADGSADATRAVLDAWAVDHGSRLP